MRVFVIALDSSGNTVLNPATYDQPVTLQLIYTAYGAPDTTDTPDVSLQVAYNSAVDPSGCGGNSQTSANFGTVNVCSPSDVITATFMAVNSGAFGGELIGSVAGSGDLSAPTGEPTALPTGFAPGVSALTFTIYLNGGIELTDFEGYTVSSISANGVGNLDGVENLPLYSWEGNGYNTLYISESGFAGSYVVGGTCAPYATLTLTNNDGYGDASLLVVPTAPTSGCNITISDGTNTVTVPLTVTTTSVGPIS